MPAPTINMPNLTVTIPDPAANKTASLRLSQDQAPHATLQKEPIANETSFQLLVR